MTGYVYFASFRPHFIKIGYSTNPSTRILNVQHDHSRHIPADVAFGNGNCSIIGVLHGDRKTERQMHRKFAEHLVHDCNEWFFDTEAIRRAISSLDLLAAPPAKAPLASHMARCSWRIPTSVASALKAYCRENGMLLEFVIAEAMRDWIARSRAQKGKVSRET